MDEVPWAPLIEGGWSFEIAWLENRKLWAVAAWRKQGRREYGTAGAASATDTRALRDLIWRIMAKHEQFSLKATVEEEPRDV